LEADSADWNVDQLAILRQDDLFQKTPWIIVGLFYPPQQATPDLIDEMKVAAN
jgi:hypothetical protein